MELGTEKGLGWLSVSHVVEIRKRLEERDSRGKKQQGLAGISHSPLHVVS